MERPKISVIMPIYKAEKYLDKCVTSILQQTFRDFELLLIDDGSPDGCGRMCDEYALRDSRVKVFHKPNGGVSSARQLGTEKAQGEYIIHADPDDWVEKDMLEELYNKAINDNADMVICDFIMDFPKRSVYIKQEIKEGTDSNTILRLLLNQQLHGSCWNKLIRTSLFKKYDICFPINIIRWEDLYVICNLLLNPIKVAYIPKAFYHYDQIVNEESIVRKPSQTGVSSQILFCNYFQQKLSPSEHYEEELYTIKSCTKILMLTSELYSFDELKNIFSEINDQFIQRNRKFGITPVYILSLILQGKHLYAKFLFFMIYKVYGPLKFKLKKKFR